MPNEPFERVLRGFSPEAVTARLDALETERAYLKTQLAEAQDAHTELRLSMVKQVEEASAEAAIVLGHGRSEAARIREKAIAESDTILESARHNADEIHSEAEAAREQALSLRDEAKLEAEDIRSKAEEDALSVLGSARARASHLEEEAASTLEDAAKRSEQLPANYACKNRISTATKVTFETKQILIPSAFTGKQTRMRGRAKNEL
jgi:hypothetical protein